MTWTKSYPLIAMENLHEFMENRCWGKWKEEIRIIYIDGNVSQRAWRLWYTYGTDVVGYWQLRLTSRCRYPDPGQDLIPLQRLHVFVNSRNPHPAIKLWCQVPFTKSKTTFQIEMYCMQCLLKSIYIESRTFNDKNRWIIKKVMVFKKLLQHPGTRGTYSPGDWRCDEAWRAQTLVYPPVMCQQRLICCTWELNIMDITSYSVNKMFVTESDSVPVHMQPWTRDPFHILMG